MVNLGRYGVWTASPQWMQRPHKITETAQKLEALGYGTVWIGGASGDLKLCEQLLAATSTIKVATGVVNIWREDAASVAESHRRVSSEFPGRFLLGIGVGHAPLDPDYTQPLQKLGAYFDELDAAEPPVPRQARLLAALGPRALQIAATRAAGAHPYLVPREHTAAARAALGGGPILAPEHKVFLGTDPAEARRVARGFLAIYLRLPNYLNNLRRYGFSGDDLDGEGSDRLVDSLVAWGTDDAIRTGVDAHLDAGADHVALQVLTADQPYSQLLMAEWERAAELFELTAR
jgi:probable F420-dependent oxidoreductase